MKHITWRDIYLTARAAWRRSRRMKRRELQLAEANAAFGLQYDLDQILMPAATRLLSRMGGELFELGDIRTDQSRDKD